MSFFKLSRQFLKNSICKNFTRSYAKENECVKVTVCGAGGAVGQPLSLLLKQSNFIDTLAVYDSAGIKGFGMELSHVSTRPKVCIYSGTEFLKEALERSTVVVVVAAAPGTSHLSLNAMFEPNANVVQELAENISIFCPNAFIAVVTNPVNCMLPLMSQVLKLNGVYKPNAVFGVTAVNVIRTNTLVARLQGLQPETVVVPVIGGHSSKTIIPVLSQAKPCADFSDDEYDDLTKEIQTAQEAVTKEKELRGDNLACAFATAKFVISIVKAMKGFTNVIECAFVRSDVCKELKFLATPIVLGRKGVLQNLGLPELSIFEQCLLESAAPIIMADVRKGESFAGGTYPPPCDPCRGPSCPPDWCKVDEFY